MSEIFFLSKMLENEKKNLCNKGIKLTYNFFDNVLLYFFIFTLVRVSHINAFIRKKKKIL